MNRTVWMTACASVLLAACSGPMKEAKESAEANRETIDTTIEERGQPDSRVSEVVSDSLYFGHSEVDVDSQPEPLPKVFESDIVISSVDEVTVGDVADVLSDSYGVNMFVTPDARSFLQEIAGGGSGGNEGGDSEGGGNNEATFRLNHNGSIERLLDRMTSRTNLFWRWDDRHRRVVVFRQETETFELNTFAGRYGVEAGVEGGANASGSGDSGSDATSATNQKASFANTNLSIWESVTNSVSNLASPDADIQASETPPRITVQDTPVALDRIRSYIDDINHDLSTVVLLNVQILEVVARDEQIQGIDWNLSFDDGEFGLTSDTGFFGDTDTPNITAQILDPTDDFVDTQLFVKALKEKNFVSSVTRESAVTLNSMPVPIRVITDRGFVSSNTVTVDEGVTTAEIVQDNRIEGLEMSLLPRVMNHQRILLQFSMDLAGTVQLDEFSSGDSTVQVPTQSRQEFLQRVAMRTGQTLVLSGYDEALKEGGKSSGLGGFRGNGRDRDVSTMVIITPHILDS